MIESGNLLVLRPRHINIRDEVSSIYNQLLPSAVTPSLNPDTATKRTNINIGNDVPAVIRVDRCLLRALFNLMKNAVYISSEDAMISFTISCNKPQASLTSVVDQHHNFYVSLRISKCKQFDIVDIHKSFHSYYNIDLESKLDDSTGMKEEFSHYFQSTPAYGTALGWYVSYNIIQNLGGTLQCEMLTDGSLDLCFAITVRYPPSTLSDQSSMFASALFTPDDQLTGEISPELSCLPSVNKQVAMMNHKLSRRHILFDSDSTLLDLAVADDNPVAKHRILVVDDSPICQKVLMKILNSAGYDVELADNGKVSYDERRTTCTVLH
jgi:hypothetical protein